MARDPRFGASLGAHVEAGGVRFRAYATTAKSCAVRIVRDDGSALEPVPMLSQGDGFFEAWLEHVGHGTLYQLVLDGRELPDPYGRYFPHGVHGPAMVVVEPQYVFRAPHGPRRALSSQVIYELHVGTFSPQGTYAGARARLPALHQLGVTALELMPVAAFAGARGWGYDGVALFAPFAPYGTPDELRAFVDEAHVLGFDVILDVVYNHFGPAGNYLAAYAPEYFSRDIKNAWGDAPNYAHPAMRAFVLDNVRMWLESYHFDGLRLDAVHAIVDPSAPHVLEALVDEVRAIAPDALLLGEDDRNDPTLITRTGLDALWADDFHHEVRVTLTGERDGYYAAYEPSVAALAHTIERGWLYEGQIMPTSGRARGKPADALAAACFVYCIQNHDQVGNRALGDRLTDAVSLDAYRMVSALLLVLPMTPMLFMGQEWAATSPFSYFTDHEPELGAKVSAGRREEFKHFRAFAEPSARASIPDPQALTTFERSKLSWDEREREPHASVLSLYTELLALRRSDPVLSSVTRAGLSADAVGELLRVRMRSDEHERIFAANFSRETVSLDKLDLPPDAVPMWTSRGELDAHALAPHTALLLRSRAGATTRKAHPGASERLALDVRTSGVLLHVTSLPGPQGVGDLGEGARVFVDFLAAAKQRWWQMLPVNPTGFGHSPYSGVSAFAGHPLLISLSDLVRDGLLRDDELPRRAASARADYAAAPAHAAALHIACQRFRERRGAHEELERFRERTRHWLPDYALFMALRDASSGASWTSLDEPVARHEPRALAQLRHALREQVTHYEIEQLLFDVQWRALRSYAAERGVGLIGDAPIFVAHDSADVWAHQHVFDLDPRGAPNHVSGVPPDMFSETGQRWGTPLYRWDVLARDGYRFWVERARTLLERFDLIRLDHFIGFARYWQIPVSEDTAVRGRWMEGPKDALFEALRRELGSLPFIAEDLGSVTDEVRGLRDRLGLPGMRVLQFAFAAGDPMNEHLPHNYVRNCVAYTGTHDNDSLLGWFEGTSPWAAGGDDPERERSTACAYVWGLEAEPPRADVHWHMIRTVLASVANTAIVPMQDLLGLGSDARMNTPGRAHGNWTFRMNRDALSDELAATIAAYTRLYGRAAPEARDARCEDDEAP